MDISTFLVFPPFLPINSRTDKKCAKGIQVRLTSGRIGRSPSKISSKWMKIKVAVKRVFSIQTTCCDPLLPPWPLILYKENYSRQHAHEI